MSPSISLTFRNKGHHMSDSERVFVSYRVPARSPAAVRNLLIVGVVTVTSFENAWRLIKRGLPDMSIPGCMFLTLGIVTAVVTTTMLLKYVRNQDEDIQVTDHSITGDSRTWTWDKVLQVDFHRRTGHVCIHLNNGPARSRLSLLIQVPGIDPEGVMRELQSFVEARGISIRNRGA